MRKLQTPSVFRRTYRFEVRCTDSVLCATFRSETLTFLLSIFTSFEMIGFLPLRCLTATCNELRPELVRLIPNVPVTLERDMSYRAGFREGPAEFGRCYRGRHWSNAGCARPKG